MFNCDVCGISTSNKKDYRRHLSTIKHAKCCMHATMVNEHSNTTCVNTDATNRSHNKQTDNDIQSSINNAQTYKCKYCDVSYKFASGLSRHMKSCIAHIMNNQAEVIKYNSRRNSDTNQIIQTLLQENKEFKQMIINVVNGTNEVVKVNGEVLKSTNELVKNANEVIKNNQDIIFNQQDTHIKMLEICKNNSTASITNNVYNHRGNNNNTFNLQLFLNEDCKDAMNMSEFVESIQVKMEDLENVGRVGYVEGISTIFIDNLKNTDVHKRPIHCSDFKRDTLYVKDDNRWERNGITSQKLKNAVRFVEQKNIGLINDWANQHPKCENSETHENKFYMKISGNVLDGEDGNIIKVLKRVSKEVIIGKE